MTAVSIAGLDPAAVLKALYDRVTAGYHQTSHQAAPPVLPIEHARAMIKAGQLVFDHVYGRKIGVRICGDSIDVAAYDAANGAGVAEDAVAALRPKTPMPGKTTPKAGA
jgi:hypothetical protein